MMVDVAPAKTEIDLRRYWDVLLTRWLVVVIVAALGVVLAAGYLIVAPKTYTATTTVSVFPITTDPYAANRNSNSLVNMNAETVLASSFKVADLAASSLDSEWKAAALRSSTSATAGADSTTMTITVSASSERSARTGASAVANAYLLARSDQASKSINALIDQDTKRIGEHRKELTEVLQRLADAASGSQEAADASSDQQIINQQISVLVARISSLQGIDTTGGVILNPASATAVTVKPSNATVLATGLAVGIVVGIILAFLTRPRRKTLRTDRDVWRELDVETLGRITGDDEASLAIVASSAQRLLRVAAINGARVVALVFDATALHPEELAERFVVAMTASGVPSTVMTAVDAENMGPVNLVLVPVKSNDPEATLLHVLRVSDIAILVAGIGTTRVRAVAALNSAAEDMGTPIAGVILAPGDTASVRSGAKHEARAKDTRHEDDPVAERRHADTEERHPVGQKQ